MPERKNEYMQPTHAIEAVHVNAALAQLTDAQQKIVRRQARLLANEFNRMGEGLALEVLAKIGVLL